MDNQEYDYRFKIILLGERRVGKTSMLLRLSENTFYDKYSLYIPGDSKTKTIKIENKKIKANIQDLIAPSERYKNIFVFISTGYYRGSHGIIIIYDISNRHSFEKIINWIKEIEFKCSSNARKILVGNKSDLSEREVTEEEGKLLADKFNMHFFETSCKTGDNVKEAFEFLIKDIVEKKESNITVNIQLKKSNQMGNKTIMNNCIK